MGERERRAEGETGRHKPRLPTEREMWRQGENGGMERDRDRGKTERKCEFGRRVGG